VKRRLAVQVLSLSTLFGAPWSAGAATFAEFRTERLRLAQEKSPDLTVARLELQAAEASRGAARGRLLPELGVRTGWESHRATLTGETRSQAFGTLFTRFNLFRGGSDWLSWRVGDAKLEAAQARIDGASLVAQLGVERLLLELGAAERKLEVNAEARSLTHEQLAMASRKKESGLTSEADLIDIRFRAARLESERAGLTLERDDRWRELVAVTEGTPEPLPQVPASPLLVEALPSDAQIERWSKEQAGADLESLASRRADLREQSRIEDVARQEATIARAALLPSLDLEGSWGQPAFGDREGVSDTPQTSIQLRLEWVFFAGGRDSGAWSALRSEAQAAEARSQRLRIQARTELLEADARWSATLARLRLETENVERAKSYYSITLAEYRRGVKNAPDLASATERWVEAKARNADLRRDLGLVRLQQAAARGLAPQGN